MSKLTFVFDIEIFRNYLLIGFMDIETDEVVSVECVGENSRLSKKDRQWLRDFMRRHRTVGFNSRNFDFPILYGAIAGMTCLQLKGMANDIIEGGMKHWEIADAYGIDIPR